MHSDPAPEMLDTFPTTPAPVDMERHTEAGKEKPRQRFIDEVWPGVKPG